MTNCAFNIGDIVEFNDELYAEDYRYSRRFLHTKGKVVNIRKAAFRVNEFLVQVHFANGSLEAFEHRFILISGSGKNRIEAKVNDMFERQPYYKSLKGNI